MGEPGAAQGGTGQVRTGQVGTGQVCTSRFRTVQVRIGQVKTSQAVQVKMVMFYLGLECGPTQSYLLIHLCIYVKIQMRHLQKYH